MFTSVRKTLFKLKIPQRREILFFGFPTNVSNILRFRGAKISSKIQIKKFFLKKGLNNNLAIKLVRL